MPFGAKMRGVVVHPEDHVAPVLPSGKERRSRCGVAGGLPCPAETQRFQESCQPPALIGVLSGEIEKWISPVDESTTR